MAKKELKAKKEYFTKLLNNLMGYREKNVLNSLVSIKTRIDNNRKIYTFTNKEGYSFEYDATNHRITN